MEEKMKKTMLFFFLVTALFLSAQTSVSIYDIQYTTDPGTGNTYPSPYDGQIVITTGIVNAINFKGYKDNIYITMPEGGEWKGLYVYGCGDTTLVVGDEVEVTGSITEYYGLTEMNNVTSTTLLSSGNAVPAPVIITTEQMATEEAYESVLIELNDVYVSQELDDHGQWYVVDTTTVPCQVDDGFFYLDAVTPPIVITLGDNWAVVRGVVSYSYDEYELNPRTPDDLIQTVGAGPVVTPVTNSLIGNYPNPFNPTTEIAYNLVREGFVSIGIYNVKGEKVTSLVNSVKTAGAHEVVWNGTDAQGSNVSSGVYFYKMNSDDTNTTDLRKMVLMK